MLAVLDERGRERPMHAIRVRDRRALAGRVGIRLVNLHPGRQHAVGVDDRLVVLDLGPRPVAEDPLVHEGKVPDIEKVLDHARTTGVHAVRSGPQQLVRGIAHELERRNLGRPAAQRRPDDPMRFPRVKGRHPRLCRRLLLRMSGHQHAAPVGCIRPAVIGALEAHAVDDLAERQARAAMHAQVAPCMNFVPGAPDDEVFT